MSESKPVGRPPKYSDPQQLQIAIDAYFNHCDDTYISKPVVQKGVIFNIKVATPYTMIGLAIALDIDRSTLLEWKENSDNLSLIVTRAKRKIEEHNLTYSMVGCYDSKIATLNLASNYGYADRQDHSLLVETYESRLARITAEKQAQLPGPKEAKT